MSWNKALVSSIGLSLLVQGRVVARPILRVGLGLQRARATPTDPAIARVVREIDPRNVERTIRTLAGFGTRNTLSSQSDPKRGIGAACDWIDREFLRIRSDSGGRLTVEELRFVHPASGKVVRPAPVTDIVATLPGTDPISAKRLILVSGHYDSRCGDSLDAVHDAPGADDDASGVAAVLEIARVMARRRFPATLVFMAVAGEEQGLWGSTYLAERAKKSGWSIEAMLNNDIIGASLGGSGVRDRGSVRVFSEGIASDEMAAEARVRRSVDGEDDSVSRQLARFIRETAARYVPAVRARLISRRDRYLRGGDQIPFLERGYPAVRFTESSETYAHQHQNVRRVNGVVYGDLPEFVDFGYLANVARINAAAMASLALAPAPPAGVQVVARRLSSDTDLEWLPNRESGLAGYEVVWRDTDAPDWTQSLPVGRVTRFALRGRSKDDFDFGVRAVDRRGHRSPVSFARPGR